MENYRADILFVGNRLHGPWKDPEKTFDNSEPGEQTREAPTAPTELAVYPSSLELPPGSQLQLSLHLEALHTLFGIFSVTRPACLTPTGRERDVLLELHHSVSA